MTVIWPRLRACFGTPSRYKSGWQERDWVSRPVSPLNPSSHSSVCPTTPFLPSPLVPHPSPGALHPPTVRVPLIARLCPASHPHLDPFASLFPILRVSPSFIKDPFHPFSPRHYTFIPCHPPLPCTPFEYLMATFSSCKPSSVSFCSCFFLNNVIHSFIHAACVNKLHPACTMKCK